MRDGSAIIRALGGKRGHRRWLFCCPCHNDRSPSASLRDDGQLKCFAGCDAKEMAKALDTMGLKDDGRRVRPVTSEEIRVLNASASARAQAVWNACKPTYQKDLSSVEFYLRSRGITLPVPPVMRRYHISGWIACAQNLSNEITSVQHRMPWQKPYMVGVPNRGAIRLAPYNKHLGLAEGLETAMSATQITGVPCWCCMGADNFANVDIPRDVQVLHLFHDNDQAGLRALNTALRVYSGRGFEVWKRDLDPAFKDWNDILKRALHDATWWEQWQKIQKAASHPREANQVLLPVEP